jgi:hypothetical protein
MNIDFSDGAQGWIAGFADYPAGQEAFYELRSGIEFLPAPLDTRKTGFLLSGNNHSDDLLAYMFHEIRGLAPETPCALRCEIEFATDAPRGAFGIGGAPGESVFLKVGAIDRPPTASPDEGGLLRLNADLGNQANSGSEGMVLGNIANARTAEEARQYELKTLGHTNPLPARTDASGRLWLIVAFDSGFEGSTTLYFTRIRCDISLTST